MWDRQAQEVAIIAGLHMHVVLAFICMWTCSNAYCQAYHGRVARRGVATAELGAAEHAGVKGAGPPVKRGRVKQYSQSDLHSTISRECIIRKSTDKQTEKVAEKEIRD